MSLKDYVILVLGIVITVGMAAWVLLDRSLDWSRTLIFPPTLSILVVGGCTIGFVAFFVIAIVYVLKA